MNNIDVYSVTFKNYTYELPKTTTYSKLDENRFKLISDEYEAVIEPLYDKESIVSEDPERYYEVLLNNGINVSKPEKMKIGFIGITKYEKIDSDANSTLYYFTYSSPIIYEIELYNLQDNLGRVMNILLSATVDEKENYDYREITTNSNSND